MAQRPPSGQAIVSRRPRGNRSAPHQASLCLHRASLDPPPASCKGRGTSHPLSLDVGRVLSTIGAGYLRVDRQYVVREANAAALTWLGLSDRDVIGQPFSRLSPKSPMRMLRSAVEGTIFIDRELRSYCRPERVMELHIHSVDGGAILYFRDITDMRRSEQDAEHARALLQCSLDALSAHVVILDQRGTVIASNRSWRRFVEARGDLPIDLVDHLNYLALYEAPWRRQPEARAIAATLRSVLSGRRQAARLVYAWQNKARLCWFQLSVARFQINGDTHLVVTNEEITAIREAEQALGRVSERLLTLQEEERKCIAEDLHDSTVQHLVAIGLNVMALRDRIGADAGPLLLLREIEDSLDEASKELRTLTYLLHPPRLERDGLCDTLRRYVDGFARRTGLHAALRASREVDKLDFALQRTALRIVQEGLTNVYRHAGATRVRIDLRCLRRRLHLLIQDNGRGIATTTETAGRGSEPPRPGVGIPGIRARLEQLGGRLQIWSGHNGTRLHAVAPFTCATALPAGVSPAPAWRTGTRSRP